MSTPTRRSRPRPWRFIAVGGILGFVVLGILSMLRPDTNEGFDVSYDPSVSLGFMSLFGLFLGALLGALLAALLAVRADRSAERAARAEGVGQAPVDDRPRDQDADRGEAADSVDAAPRRDATD
ncbi:hypothetical protein GCM10027055_02580 [Janibacter alkaliphilus]|uniref:Uncharacterized protein n=1 Tax=Janibacter alkaliphilus TaxID=1069963 RepID=A0A852X7Y5_9MICO|nr:hypothetical protein [Janibacter alkaliphilus]NYG36873.1 hypothetical protein [Janibacter alkaliphilus]